MADARADCPAQVDGLEITPVEGGFVVHDAGKDRVHHLNHVAVVVLTLCNGRNRIELIADLLQKEFDLPAPPKDDVAEIVAQFADEGLVVFRPDAA